MAILLATNVSGNLIVSAGSIQANATPMVNNITVVTTGLSANLTANAQTNNNTAQSNLFGCYFNEPGMYAIDAMIFYGHNTTTLNVANIGMNIAFGNGSTATIASIKYAAASGRANGTTITTNLITTTAQTSIIPGASIANSTNNADYIVLTGYMNVSVVGTVNVQIAATNTANGNVNVSSNSYVIYTKIG